MATSYPGALDTFLNPLGTDQENVVLHATQHTHANDAVLAVETALGINPKGAYADVSARIAHAEGLIGAAGSAAATTYDPSTSGAATIPPIPAYDLQTALDFLNRDITDRDEQTYLVAKRDTLYSVYALAGASPQTTPDGLIPGLARTVSAVNTVNSGTAVTLGDAVAFPLQDLTLNGVTPAITMPTAVAGVSFDLIVRQDGTGSRVPSWVGTIKWPGGAAPTITATASSSDSIHFQCSIAGTWRGMRVGTDIR